MLRRIQAKMDQCFNDGYDAGYDRGLLDMQMKAIDTVSSVLADVDTETFNKLCTALEADFKVLLFREKEP